MSAPFPVAQHVPGRTFHGRRGGQANRFAYGVDYLLIDPAAHAGLPWIFRRNRPGLVSLHDADHGGAPGAGEGLAWVRRVLDAAGLGAADGQVLLLAQPRILGHVFNPVAFWLCHGRDGSLRCVIAEVTNTYGDRHSYLCHHDDQRPITPACELAARKVLHVSPFQPVAGAYRFRFDIAPERIAIRIDYDGGKGGGGQDDGGLVATLAGPRRALTTPGLLRAMLRRPLGSRRVLALIHWQALRLWWKGARFRPRPLPPAHEVSR